MRAAFDVRTGARTTLERLRHELGLEVRGLAVPKGLEELTAERHGGHGGAAVFESGAHGAGLPWFAPGLLLVNGRCVVPLPELVRLELGECMIETGSGQVIAARPATRAQGDGFLRSLRAEEGWRRIEHERPVLLRRPWHVRAFLEDALSTDLISMASHADEPELRGVMAFGDAPLAIQGTAKVCPGVVFDCENGPIVVDDHAVVRPGAVVVGPAYVGQHSTVIERALVKAHSSIGPWCKVAGEVGGVVFQGFSNKGHDGHLGDAYVGEWSNLGAGTTNSNLLNTYGEVTMRAGHGQPLERTGRQFMGCVIGDHVKTAICTRIMTGTTIGLGAMIAQGAAVSGAVAPFTWATDESPVGTGKMFRKDKFLEVARAAMARRKHVMSEAQARRIGELAGW